MPEPRAPRDTTAEVEGPAMTDTGFRFVGGVVNACGISIPWIDTALAVLLDYQSNKHEN